MECGGVLLYVNVWLGVAKGVTRIGGSNCQVG